MAGSCNSFRNNIVKVMVLLVGVVMVVVDVGAYTEHEKIISRIFLAPLPTGNACFVNPHFWQFCPMAANKGENVFFQTKLTPLY